MAAFDVRGATISSLAEAVRARKTKSRELTEAYLERVARLDAALGSYLLVAGDAARKRADEIDRAIAAGEPVGPLGGVPIALKDIFVTKGIETTCASKILRGFVPPFESTPSERLAAAGAVGPGQADNE